MPVYSQYTPQILVNWLKIDYYDKLMDSNWPLDKILRILSIGVTRLVDGEGFNPFFEAYHQLIFASQTHFPIQKKECNRMSLHQSCGVWVDKKRRYGNDERERVLPVIFHTRLLKIIIGYYHMDRESRSIFSRRLHHPAESINRQNIMSEVGVTSPKFEQLVRVL